KTRQALELLRDELDRLLADGPTEDEVDAAKMQLKGSIVMAQESLTSRMYHVARQEMQLGCHTTTQRQLEQVLEVTRDQVVETLRTLLAPARFPLAVRGPVDGAVVTETDWPVAQAVS